MNTIDTIIIFFHSFFLFCVCVYSSALVGGTDTGALPLPGWDNWDCSLRNCPKGHTSNVRYGLTANKEIQRVACSKSNDANVSDYMIFEFMGKLTGRVYTNDTRYAIKAAIEEHPYIGNVTVSFPLYDDDNVRTACWTNVNETHGGFSVQFDTEFGDLPLLNSLYDLNVLVEEVQAGESVSVLFIVYFLYFTVLSSFICIFFSFVYFILV